MNSSQFNTYRSNVNTSSRPERFPNIGDNFSNRYEATNIRWKCAEMLGQGAFGVVYLGLNVDTGELMAVKQMATDEVSKRELSSLENEINLLRNLRHPNIVRYIGTELTASSMSIFLEYVPGGSLKKLIDKFGALEEAVAKSYTRQLLMGLEYLHRNGFAHRDIKGANCLVGSDGVIKLADFGNSKHWRATAPGSSIAEQPSGDIKGTPSWMAPEVIRDQGGSISWKKADVWSLACTTLEMTTGKPPWSQFNNSVTILYHIACQDTLPEYPNPASVEKDPSKRPDITSLLLHPFVASNIPSSSGWAAVNRPSTVSSSVISNGWDSQFVVGSAGANSSSSSSGSFMQGLRGASDFSHPSSASVSTVTTARGIGSTVQSVSLLNSAAVSAAAAAAQQVEQVTPRLNIAGGGGGGGYDPFPAIGRSYSRGNQSARESLFSQSPRPGYIGGVGGSSSSAGGGVSGSSGAVANNASSSLDSHASSGGGGGGLFVPPPMQQQLSTPRLGIGRLEALAQDYADSDTRGIVGGSIGASSSSSSIGGTQMHHQQQQQQQQYHSLLQQSLHNQQQQQLQQYDPEVVHEAPFLMDPLEGDVSVSHQQYSCAVAAPGSGNVGVSSSSITGMPLAAAPLGLNAANRIHMPPITISTPTSTGGGKSSSRSAKRSEKTHRKRQNSTTTIDSLPASDGEGSITSTPTTSAVVGAASAGAALSATKKRSGRASPAPANALGTMSPSKHLTSGAGGGGGSASKSPPNFKKPVTPSSSSSVAPAAVGGVSIPMLDFDKSSVQGHSSNSSSGAGLSHHITGSGGDKHSRGGVGGSSSSHHSSSRRIQQLQQQHSSEMRYYDSDDNGSIYTNRQSTVADDETVSVDGQTESLTGYGTDTIDDDLNSDRNSARYSARSSARMGALSEKTLESVSYDSPSNVGGLPSSFGGGGGRGVNHFTTIKEEDYQSILAEQSFVKPSKGNSNISPSWKKNTGGSLSNGNTPKSARHARSSSNSGKEAGGGSGKGPSASAFDWQMDSINVTQVNDELLFEESSSSAAFYHPQVVALAESVAPSTELEELSSLSRGGGGGGAPISRLSISGTGTAANAAAVGTVAGGGSSSMKAEVSKLPVLRGTTRTQRSRSHKASSTPAAAEKDMTEALDISCDSLEHLQINGVSAGGGGGGGNFLGGTSRDFSRTQDRESARTAKSKRLTTTESFPVLDVSMDRLDNSFDAALQSAYSLVLPPQSLMEHTGPVTRLRAPQRTNLLVSSSTDGTIRIWGPNDTRSRHVIDAAAFGLDGNERPERKIVLGKGPTVDLSSVSSDPPPPSEQSRSHATVKLLNVWAEEACETLWAACSDGAVRVWSGSEGRPLRLLKGHEESVTAMEGIDGAVSGGVQQASCLIGTGSADRTVRIWDVRVKKPQVFIFRGHGDTVVALRWGEGGRSLISGGKDKTIRIWDTRAGRLRVTLEKHFGTVNSLRVYSDNFSSRGISTAGGGGGGGPSGSMMTSSSNNNNSGSSTAGISFLSAGRDSMLNVWTSNGDCISSQVAHRGSANFLSEINYGFTMRQNGAAPVLMSPLMASLGADNIIKVWDLKRFKAVAEISSPASAGNVSKAVWCGQSLIVSSNTGVVRQYECSPTVSTTATAATAATGSAGVSGTMGGGGGGAMNDANEGGKVSLEWSGRELAAHTQACTDLLSTEHFVASSSRSGQILRWNL